MKNKTRIKKSLAPITEEQARTALAFLRNAEITRQTAIAELNRVKAAADAHYAPQLAVIENTIKNETATLQSWAEANPLAFGKLKSITWPAGKFGFRTGTPKLALLNRKWTWKSVMSVLSAGWIRLIHEVDKEAILSDYAKGVVNDGSLQNVGLRVTQDETFYIEPNLETTDPRQTTTTPIKEAA